MTIDDFKVLYPDLSQSFIDEQIGSKLRLADLLINRIGAFGDMRDEALSLLAAHLLAMGKVIGKSGAAVQTKTSKSIGQVSFNYAIESGDRAWYNLTGYGQQLLFLIDLIPKNTAAFVV